MNAQERYAEVAARYGLKNPSRKNVTGMPLGEGFTPYKQRNQTGPELVAGLGSLFGGEGPESLGTMVNIPGADFRPGGRRASIRDLSKNLDFKSKGALESYIKDISEQTMGYEDLSIPVEGLVPDEGGLFGGGGPFLTPSGQQFGFGDDISGMREAYDIIQDNAVLPRFDQGEGTGNKKQENILEAEAAEIEALLGNDPVFDDPMSDIAALVEEAQKVSTKLTPTEEETRLGIDPPEETVFTGSGRGEINEKPGERKAYLSNLSDEEKDQVVENSFAAAMSDYNESAGKAPPKENESKKDALARYKKEFEEATGIDASGKVDKSRALMAFGLALMKNKGGNFLEELADAGEKAMPYVDKARSEAKAAQLSAGNYALVQQKSDVTAERAAIAASAKFKKDMYLKWYDSSLKREENLLKSKLTIKEQMAEAKAAGKDFTKVDGRTYAVGQGSAASWEVKYVYDSTDPNGGFLLKPENAIKKHIQGREGVTDARELITGLRGAAAEIAEGGGSQAFVYDKLLSFGKAVMPATYLTGQPTNVEDYDKGVKSILAEFKRFLTQETGNGISNKDVEIWEKDLMGNLQLFSNLDATNAALDKLDRIFYRKEAEFDGALEELLDPTNHEQSTRAEILRKFGTYEDLQGQGDLVFVDGKIQRVGN
jgi:hypothetical protein